MNTAVWTMATTASHFTSSGGRRRRVSSDSGWASAKHGAATATSRRCCTMCADRRASATFSNGENRANAIVQNPTTSGQVRCSGMAIDPHDEHPLADDQQQVEGGHVHAEPTEELG